MPSLSISLLQLLPMIYAAALLPVVLARSVRALWLPARVAADLRQPLKGYAMIAWGY